MKTLPLFCLLGLLSSAPFVGRAESSRQDNILGKFVVTSMNGAVTCVSEGRILELKKGDAIQARGATVSTGPHSNATLVFSNGTGVFTDENTSFKIERFDQESFAPNSNLRVEPSNSTTLAKLAKGRVVLSTPRLLSGSSIVYQTPHASVSVRGEKMLIEANDEDSHIAMLAGNATVHPRDAAGNFLALGERVISGQEALVTYTLNGSASREPSLPPAATDIAPSESGTTADVGSPATSSAVGSNSEKPAEALVRVLKLAGLAEARLPGQDTEIQLSDGATIPAGSIVSTADDALLFLQPYAGAVAAILPRSVVEIERLSITPEDSAAPRRSSTLTIRAGSVVSMLDPAAHAVNEYAIRTLQGTAKAQGTVFAASVKNGGLILASTADAVTFTSTSGESFQIPAGQVTFAPPGQQARTPVPLAQAVAGNSELGSLLQHGFATVAALVRNDLGSFPPSASANLLAQVTASTALAFPDQAESFAAQAVATIGAPSSSLNAHVSPAIAAVLQAVVASLPDRATPTATAATVATTPQAAVIAAAAATAAPARAAQIAGAVIRLVLQGDSSSGASSPRLQTAAAIASAVTASAPDRASDIAVAAMEAALESNPNRSPALNAQRGSFIAAAVTRAAPAQAPIIARNMMRLLVRQLPDTASPGIAQTGALLAGSIIAVVPAQARPVATAVMLLVFEARPNVDDDWTSNVAGVLAGTLAQVLPDHAQEIYAGMAEAIGRTSDEIQAMTVPVASLASEFALMASSIARDSGLAFQDGTLAITAVAVGQELARGSNLPTRRNLRNIEINHSTSVVITQFDPTEFAELTLDLEAAQAAQITVQFYTEPDGNGGVTVRPTATIPETLPADLIVSPSRLAR